MIRQIGILPLDNTSLPFRVRTKTISTTCTSNACSAPIIITACKVSPHPSRVRDFYSNRLSEVGILSDIISPSSACLVGYFNFVPNDIYTIKLLECLIAKVLTLFGPFNNFIFKLPTSFLYS